jgi:hypothetical protein
MAASSGQTPLLQWFGKDEFIEHALKEEREQADSLWTNTLGCYWTPWRKQRIRELEDYWTNKYVWAADHADGVEARRHRGDGVEIRCQVLLDVTAWKHVETDVRWEDGLLTEKEIAIIAEKQRANKDKLEVQWKEGLVTEEELKIREAKADQKKQKLRKQMEKAEMEKAEMEQTQAQQMVWVRGQSWGSPWPATSQQWGQQWGQQWDQQSQQCATPASFAANSTGEPIATRSCTAPGTKHAGRPSTAFRNCPSLAPPW